MKKTPWIVAAATACVVVVGGGGTAFAMSNEAALSVYGEQSMVRTFSQPTVGELLEAQGVSLKDTDLVLPDTSAQITDGIEIQIIQRTPVTVTVDGEEQEVLTTGDTVADALDEVDYDADGAAISPAPETELTGDSAEVDVVTRKTVTFKGQNGQDTFDVTALTVDDAMKKVLGDIEDTDKASVDRDSILEDGATITVKRVREAERTETEEIPFTTKTVEDDTLLEGKTKTKTEGKKGTAEKVFAETTVDGEVTESELVSEETTAEPVTEVVLKGTKKAPQPEAPAETTSEKSSSSDSSSSSSKTTRRARRAPRRAIRRTAARAAPSGSPPTPDPARAHRRCPTAPCGTVSPSASPAATGRSTPATATTAASSSTTRRGLPTAAPRTRHGPTSRPANSRSPSPRRSRPTRAGAPGPPAPRSSGSAERSPSSAAVPPRSIRRRESCTVHERVADHRGALVARRVGNRSAPSDALRHVICVGCPKKL